MLESNDDLRKSITFLTPGVKLVVKTFPSESFSRMEQLKSFDEIWKRSSSERVCTNFALFSVPASPLRQKRAAELEWEQMNLLV
jgi:hypothetical protein